MKRHIAILLSIAALLLGGCVKEQFGPDSVLKDGEGWLFLNFGAKDAVQISTKATLGYASENQILNIYVFIFDSKGNKVFGNWLQSEDRLDSEDAVKASPLDKCWYVANTTSEGTPSRGCLKVKIPTGDNLTVYLITNLNADMVKISSDLLASSVNNEKDLKDFTMQLNQYTVSRNAYFPMSGSRSGIVVTGTAQDLNNKSTVLKLKRLDSKINFKFVTGTRPDENGQVAKSFQALRWKVVNVPVTSRVIEDPNEDSYMASPTISKPEEYAEAAKYFFDTDWVNYERAETSKDMSFSFYMMENRQTPKNKSFPSYNDRSREVKTSAGLNSYVHVDYIDKRGRNVSKNIKQFVNANDFSTYVVVEGRVEMDLHDDDKGKVLGADVVYLIHLGDWNATIATAPGSYSKDDYKNVDNFAIKRNHSYNYTVTINSVNNIRVEVENETEITENQPGATGMVTIAKEEIAVCDAHYVSKTMTFHAKNFVKVGMDGSMTDVSNTLTWKVKTPFCNGSPRIENGIDIPEGLDYKWVHFRLNKKASDGSYYSDQRRKYTTRPFAYSEVYRDADDNKEDDGTPGLAGFHNDGVMDIIDIVKYIKDQAKLYVDYNNKVVETYTGDFDNGLVNGVADPEGPKICVTAFVDEYYYEEHPLTGVKDQTLWKQFVNKPDRTMHILSDSSVSKDLESSTTGSVITIQQHSIQSFFNTDESETALHTAWGLEHMDEFPDIWQWGDNTSAGNTDLFNGMLNTCKLWGLCGSSSTTFNTGKSWSNYMNIEVNNDTPQLLKDGTHNKLRYSCMTRNRDNNGDGKIDRDEVRWYAASIRQLIGIYVGEGVISPTSRLYNRSPEDRANKDTPAKWMQHVCSSTWQGNGESLVWAEEGISTGPYGKNQEGASEKMSVRCVRNFGMDADHSLEDLPQDYVRKEKNPDNGATVYNLSFVNKASLRDYSSIELPLHLENEKENYLYEKFEVATEFVSGNSLTFQGFNEAITTAISQGGSNPYCPKGYRTPNQREMAIMAYNKLYDDTEFNYYKGSSKGNMMSRTAFSFGYYGSKTVPTKYGYGYSSLITLWNTMTASTTRCVKDIRVD